MTKFGGNRTLACVAMMCAAAILAVPSKCQAQYPDNFHSFTADFSYGGARVEGRDGSSVRAGQSFQVGGGIALTPRPAEKYKNGKLIALRRWNVFLTANFMSDRSGINQTALTQAIALNPQNTALLSATSAKASYGWQLNYPRASPAGFYPSTPRWRTAGAFSLKKRNVKENRSR